MGIKPARRTSSRPYRSPLREAQAAETREKIMQATKDYLEAKNIRDLTLRRIADLAGVSAPTVYAHFPTLDDLLVAFYFWVWPRLGLDAALPTLPELEAVPHQVFQIYDRHACLLRNLLSRPSWERVREAGWSAHHAAWVEAIGKDLPWQESRQIHRAAMAVSAFWAPTTWDWLIRSCGFSPEEARKTASWAIRALVDAMRRPPVAPLESDGTVFGLPDVAGH
jgi:AcrR family transcriptional regulator